MQETIYSASLGEPAGKVDGRMTVEAYTIIYNRDGSPKEGIVLGKLENGRRTIAEIMSIAGKEKDLEKYEQNELVGVVGTVKYDSKQNRNHFFNKSFN